MNAIANMARLTRAGAVLAWSGARVLPDEVRLPPPLTIFRRMTAPLRKDKANGTGHEVANEARLSTALTSLGPSYIKLGQFLATRDDIIGRELAADLSTLQDRLPPFSQDEARKAVEDALEAPIDTLFAEFGPPAAAASIAQVHKALVHESGGALKPVAVKVLRPGIELRFNKDLDSYFFAARMIERFHPPSRRLRPQAVVETLAKSVAIEMDLRMEAAAISEMAENSRNDEGFRVPDVDWSRSARRVLTLEWIDGVPISDHETLRESTWRPADADVPAPRHARRLLPRRHASGEFVHRRREPHRRRRFRHHGAAWAEGAALPRRDPARLHNAQLPARGRGAFRGRLRAAAPFRRSVRAGLARHRRADHGPTGKRDFHGAASRAALPIHRSVRHADTA
jgi:hypothetical protein